MNRVILIAALVLAWAIWSGMPKPLLIGLGIASVVVVKLITRRMEVLSDDAFSLHLGVRILPYWGWLLVEMIKSSIDVARIVLDPKLPISPTVVDVDVRPRGPVGQVILANSITLTPGTLTIDLDGGRLRAHALTRAGADALREGGMGRRVAAITGD